MLAVFMFIEGFLGFSNRKKEIKVPVLVW